MSKTLRTEVRKVADIWNCVKGSTHFLLDGTSMLTALTNLIDILVCVQNCVTLTVNTELMKCSHNEG